jgi:chemotaxis protein histidine kinase CheA
MRGISFITSCILVLAPLAAGKCSGRGCNAAQFEDDVTSLVQVTHSIKAVTMDAKEKATPAKADEKFKLGKLAQDRVYAASLASQLAQDDNKFWPSFGDDDDDEPTEEEALKKIGSLEELAKQEKEEAAVEEGKEEASKENKKEEAERKEEKKAAKEEKEAATSCSKWTKWSPCSATCGTGQQSRSRYGGGCEGNLLEARNCKKAGCPENSEAVGIIENKMEKANTEAQLDLLKRLKKLWTQEQAIMKELKTVDNVGEKKEEGGKEHGEHKEAALFDHPGHALAKKVKEGEGEGEGEGEAAKEEHEKEEPEEHEDEFDHQFFQVTKPIANKFIILDPHMAIAVALLFAISFMFCLVYITSWPALQIRFYAWLLINTTVSIFVAVLLYQAIDGYMNHKIFPAHSLLKKGVQNTVLCLFMYFLMLFMTCVTSGAFRYIFYGEGSFVKPGAAHHLDGSKPGFTSPISHGQELHDGQYLEISIKRQKEIMRRNTRCWAMLFAHATGFAALNAGGCMQHELPKDYPLLAFTIPLGAAAAMIFFFWSIRGIRLHYLEMSSIECNHDVPEANKKDHNESSIYHEDADEAAAHAAGKVWVLHLWDEEVYDSEEDIAGLAISFLLVQAIRFNLSGHLPDNFGVEEEKDEYMHGFTDYLEMNGATLLFALALSGMVVLKGKLKQQKIPGALGRLSSRAANVFAKAFSMGFAWCILYGCMYRQASLLDREAPWTITERMILAFVLSFVGFVFIFVVDGLLTLAKSHPAVQEIGFNIIMSMAILVGFSWEQVFDRAVEVVALDLHERAKFDEENAKLLTALLVSLVVIIPWRRSILTTAMKYEEEAGPEEEECDSEEEEEAQEDQASSKADSKAKFQADPSAQPIKAPRSDFGPEYYQRSPMQRAGDRMVSHNMPAPMGYFPQSQIRYRVPGPGVPVQASGFPMGTQVMGVPQSMPPSIMRPVGVPPTNMPTHYGQYPM